MKQICSALPAILIATAGVHGQAATQPAKPNFVFFLVDDLGWGDLGCFGSTFHETPNIDKLCAEGMKFTSAYSACTVCSPSRAAILTGRYPARLHLTDWIAGHRKPFEKLSVPDWQMYIDQERITLPEALREGGYSNQFIGKWHLMPDLTPELWPEHTPEKHGFDGNIAGREWGHPKGPGRYFYPWDMPNLDGKDGDFLTDRLTDKAIDYLGSIGEKPFLLYMAYYAVHEPVMAKPEYVKKYKSKLAKVPAGTYTQTDPKYAGLVQSVDDSVGRIVEKLRAQGKLGNTIFIFTSDNGGLKNVYNGGLRGAKGTEFEGGTRVAAFVVWPGVTQPGLVCDVPIIGTDYYPTMLEMAGLPLKPEEHKDGISIVPLLKQSGSLNRDALYWHYPHYHASNPHGTIQYKGWKLIEHFEDGELMLFDLANDPKEENDLAQSKPEKAAELLKKLQDWRQQVGAQMPTPNPNYNPQKAGGGKGSGKADK
jgi:arylsulfatase A-like enzyme